MKSIVRTSVIAGLAFLSHLLVLQANAQSATIIPPAKDKAAKEVAKLLAGSYHNQAQAKADSSFFEIHLQMKPIWKKKNIGYWLYVEQAMSTALDKPYRQRVYHVFSRANGEVVSEVYGLNNPLRFAGAYTQEDPLAGLTPDSLLPRTGCEVILTKTKTGYAGATGAQSCPSDLRGAKYASSEVTLEPKQLRSWDRGYDASGKQVWGAVKGGYVFDKVRQVD